MNESDGNLDDDLYVRVARLAYLARFEAADSWARAHQIAAAVVREAAKGTPGAALDRALILIVKAGTGPSRRIRGGFGPVVPVEATEDQAEALHRLRTFDLSVRVGALLHLLENVPVSEAADKGAPYGLATEERIRDAVERVQGGLTKPGIRTLLTGDGLDPMRANVSPAANAAGRRARVRRTVAAGTAAVLVAAAGVWWFGLRTPPLGTYADDPVVHHRSPAGDTDATVGSWPARGELLGDSALLRRAADAWRTEGGRAPSGRPAVVFAGAVHDVRVVVMDAQPGGGWAGPGSSSGVLVAVYAEGPHTKSRVLVNPVDTFSWANGIRLMDADVFSADPVLLPPGVTGAETGLLTAPADEWRPAPIDSRGVTEVPYPKVTDDQRQQEASDGTFPADGIRFKLPDTLGSVKENPITLAESFRSLAPVLPSVEPSYDARQTGTPLTPADWCLAQKTAERAQSIAAYSTESLSDAASGPLPDGGGTGTVVEQEVMTEGAGMTPSGPDDLTVLRLVTTPGGTCTAAPPPPGGDPDFFVTDGEAPTPAGRYFDADAVVWTSPEKKTYLVVAASAKAAGIRVTGSVTASADGRWLVVAVPDAFDPEFGGVLIQAVDAQGHVCGSPVAAGTTSAKFCA